MIGCCAMVFMLLTWLDVNVTALIVAYPAAYAEMTLFFKVVNYVLQRVNNVSDAAFASAKAVFAFANKVSAVDAKDQIAVTAALTETIAV